MSLRVRVDYRKCEKCGGRRPLDPGHQAVLDICRDLVSEKLPISAANVWPRYRDKPRKKWPLYRGKSENMDAVRPPPTVHNMLADLVRLGHLRRRPKPVRVGRGFVVFYELVGRAR